MPRPLDPHRLAVRKRRKLRLRRHGRRAYIRSVYSLPSLATLGNAICGFGAMYVCTLAPGGGDKLTEWLLSRQFVAAAYLIFIAMLFDALDGRLARFARHTTDFGGQLDSMADVISFGAAPAFLGLQLLKTHLIYPTAGFPPMVSRLLWAMGALYMACAAVRLARFNVSNEHGEQHHFSFLGLPSPGAGAVVAALVLMQQDLAVRSVEFAHSYPSLATVFSALSYGCLWAIPVVLLVAGLLMVSTIRYPHMVNRYLRGKRSVGQLIVVLGLVLGLFVAHQYVIGLGTLAYTAMGLVGSTWLRLRTRAAAAKAERARPAQPDLPRPT
jgi:CDP-diacylglycerol--serine O-phosphatidyltransferase